MRFIHPSVLLKKTCAYIGWPGVRLWHAFAYYQLRGRWPNFKNPHDLSEHILASMNHKSFERYADYADKVKVREYIKSKGLAEILLDVYGSWEKPEEIDFDSLPEKFALKPNNGSGGHFFCKDKSKINRAAVIQQLRDGLNLVKEDITFRFERHYSKIEPRIYCEELIDTGGEAWPSDYKFMCINGQIADILVTAERETGKTKCIRFDTDWNVLPYTKKDYLPISIPPKPAHLKRMIEIAKILSADFECVRVDLYEYKNQVYFGELTFSPAGGYLFSYNDEGIKEIGKLFEK